MRWPWSKPRTTEAASVMGKRSAEVRLANTRALIRANVDDMRAKMGLPKIDWNNLENSNV